MRIASSALSCLILNLKSSLISPNSSSTLTNNDVISALMNSNEKYHVLSLLKAAFSTLSMPGVLGSISMNSNCG